MSSKAGAAMSKNADSFQASAEAAKEAMAKLGGKHPTTALLFGTGKHMPEKLRDGLRSVVGPDTQIFGGSAFGVMTHDSVSYGGHEVGVCLLSLETGRVDGFVEPGMNEDERSVGVRLATRLQKVAAKEPNVLLMYDAIRKLTNQGPMLNCVTPMLEGMQSVFGEKWPQTAGLGLIADIFQTNPYQFYGNAVLHQSGMALAFTEGLRMDTVVMHGLRPASGYHTITKADGPVVLEIDGRPAIEAITELVGAEREVNEFPLFITFGVNKGDRFADFREENYQNRLVMALDKERHGLVMFENDLRAGDEFQLMRRSIDFSYITQRAKAAFQTLGSRKPIMAFYIDCAGRSSLLCGTDGEDATEVQKAMSPHMPFFGVYAGFEIAPIAGKVSPLGWTGVLCLLSEA